MFVEPDTTYVNKLRATSGARDTLGLRIRLERALAGARLHPHELPASAILCVRKLRDPLPGGLRIESGSLQPPHAWERAVAASLSQLLKRAARPALSFVPINAEAVVFLDRPEFLASFASDWIEGNAATQWWWRSLFRTADMASVVRAWMEAPEYVPAALARLAATGNAARFVDALSVGDSRLLLRGIIRRFALNELGSSVDAVLNDGSSAIRRTNAAIPQSTARPARQLKVPPWWRWVRETDTYPLEIGQESLLATGLMLVRSPVTIRSRAFAKAMLRWYRGGEEQGPDSGGAIGLGGAEAAPDPDPGWVSKLVSGAVDTGVDRISVDGVRHLLPGPAQTSQATDLPVQSDHLAEGEKLDAPVPPEMKGTNTTDVLSLQVPTTIEQPGSTVRDSQNGPSSLGLRPEVADESDRRIGCYPEPLFETEIETEFGGLFYLINLGLFLNLYGDFTTPAQPGIELSIWDFVGLVGRGLSVGAVESDPIWSLLAQLAGRSDDDPPGKGFDPPGDWRLPSEWLAPFEEQCIWQWDSPKGRLRVWHPAGFFVLDVPLEDNPEDQLLRETKGLKDIAGFEFCSRTSPVEARSSSGLDRWLGWLMPYVGARLARAPGQHVGAAKEGWPDNNDISKGLIEHRARVVVTAADLDVFFSLQDHPIEIRLAGLDRDPGWVPAAGRYITFHYD